MHTHTHNVTIWLKKRSWGQKGVEVTEGAGGRIGKDGNDINTILNVWNSQNNEIHIIEIQKNNAFSIIILENRERLALGILGLESCGWESSHWACANKFGMLQKCVIKKPQSLLPSYDTKGWKYLTFLYETALWSDSKCLVIDFYILCCPPSGQVNNRSPQKHHGWELKSSLQRLYHMKFK